MAEQLTQGRRRTWNTEPHELEPGDYCWAGPGSILWGCSPTGEICHIDQRWSIQEHEDGTLTAGPVAPGEAYSIWINKPDDGWHGYLEHGVWRQA